MYSMQTIGPLRGPGLGAASCTPTYCFGAGSTDTLYRRLQNLANQAANKLGLVGGLAISIDGKIGPATAKRLYAVSNAMPARPDLTLLMTFDSSTSFTWVANNAARLVEELEALIDGDILMPPQNGGGMIPVAPNIPGTQIPITTTTATPTASPSATTTTMVPVGAMSTGAKIAIGASIVAVLGLGALALRRRRAPAAPVAGLGWFRRRRRRR